MEKRNAWIDAWRIGLAGMTAEQIKNALEKCAQKCEWPPSPAEFRKLVEKPIDYERMFINAANANSSGQWSDKLTYWAAVAFGRFELSRTNYQAAKIRWKIAVDAALSDDNLPEIPNLEKKYLPAPGKTFTRDVMETEMAKIKKILKIDGKVA